MRGLYLAYPTFARPFTLTSFSFINCGSVDLAWWSLPLSRNASEWRDCGVS
nr:MAG TPA: hypothetical protein [Caudoviricetes sp.]